MSEKAIPRQAKLHKHTSNIVKAHTQAVMIEALEPHLTKRRSGYIQEGSQCKIAYNGKNATMADYRKATGLEALMGYLYLSDDFERVVELTKLGVATDRNRNIMHLDIDQ